jgi:hypothetical protein
VWVNEEQERFSSLLNGNAFMLSGYKVRELFDAFLYGALLIHNVPQAYKKHRESFLNIYDNKPRENVLYALNGSLKLLLNHINNISIVVYRDFAQWIYQYSLPLPNIRWHHNLFNIPQEKSE